MVSESHPSKTDPVVVIGAGVFGLSTALELTTRGYTNVTVLDRYLPPAVDGSSVDISRIIRFDYGDAFYSKLAREAVQLWATEYPDHYHQAGFLMLNEKGGFEYTAKSKQVDEQLGKTIEEYADATRMRSIRPGIPGKLEGMSAYYNPKGGWADAASSIAQLAARCSLAGVSFVTGARGTAVSLMYQDSRVVGVKVVRGSPIRASLVILATGAWTNHLLPVGHASSASAQPVGFIQLTEGEAAGLRNMPVMINSNKGVFVFPPTPGSNILKVARHGWGYATEEKVDDGHSPARVVSCPRRDGNNARSSYMPEDAQQGLRDGLRDLVPEFAERPWSRLRLCWYSDTPEGDFIADKHPHVQGLFIATGGSGHGFKFLPVLGKYIVDCLENKAGKELRWKWRYRLPSGADDKVKIGDGSRGGPPLRLLTAEEQAKL
ncbi:FAD dependent oxidoreductase [Metarhizium guizhouense ARSEF 977]|uniref:FAD dependent oxidoreductase n=1 Tax=Metarhizium guizhouense (strain ARSEF 977) TaxID=1276136 RepID=A0A0B4GUF8_METGA|nr:FAD dependent oxidoreductase [Metarhizium guizhouense ARSEF 977]